ncbi:hypothetical protein V5O48_017491 [Marasmius crinis-equi]|uniref:Uncharacterized protein n=1 Tax=Marasmius crinis-equi TaxID=585013 RepID=A0ABR3ENV2_9AGAR
MEMLAAIAARAKYLREFQGVVESETVKAQDPPATTAGAPSTVKYSLRENQVTKENVPHESSTPQNSPVRAAFLAASTTRPPLSSHPSLNNAAVDTESAGAGSAPKNKGKQKAIDLDTIAPSSPPSQLITTNTIETDVGVRSTSIDTNYAVPTSTIRRSRRRPKGTDDPRWPEEIPEPFPPYSAVRDVMDEPLPCDTIYIPDDPVDSETDEGSEAEAENIPSDGEGGPDWQGEVAIMRRKTVLRNEPVVKFAKAWATQYEEKWGVSAQEGLDMANPPHEKESESALEPEGRIPTIKVPARPRLFEEGSSGGKKANGKQTSSAAGKVDKVGKEKAKGVKEKKGDGRAKVAKEPPAIEEEGVRSSPQRKKARGRQVEQPQPQPVDQERDDGPPPLKKRRVVLKLSTPPSAEVETTVAVSVEPAEAPVKRGRGRPRKHPLPDPNAPKRPVGRPRKDAVTA